jgi:hypothetical protein
MMDRKQTEMTGKPEGAELAIQEDAAQKKQPGYGRGAASALEFLRRLERDRFNTLPADDRPAS